MKVHDAALKHGIRPDDAIHAATWAIWIDDLDEESPARQLRLGFDTQRRLLETVFSSSTAATSSSSTR